MAGWVSAGWVVAEVSLVLSPPPQAVAKTSAAIKTAARNIVGVAALGLNNFKIQGWGCLDISIQST